MTTDPKPRASDDDVIIVPPEPPAPASNGGALRAYLQLFRAPAVFTALADVMLGFFFAWRPSLFDEIGRPWTPPWALLAILMGTSALLYTAGMVLNDFFDAEVDAVERPERPIPSGRVSRSRAGWLGAILLACGIGLGWLASLQSPSVRPGLIASGLAAAVLLYDGVLKRTPIGPLGMGACRMLNVLLGISAGFEEFAAVHFVLAGGIGLYIVGVTLFARSEAETSNVAILAIACLIMAGGIALVGWFPNWAAAAGMELDPSVEMTTWQQFMGLLGALILYRCVMAIVEAGHPALVQRAVTHCLRSLIVLDGFACAAAAGMVPAVAILCLLVPTLILGWWLYST